MGSGARAEKTGNKRRILTERALRRFAHVSWASSAGRAAVQRAGALVARCNTAA